MLRRPSAPCTRCQRCLRNVRQVPGTIRPTSPGQHTRQNTVSTPFAPAGFERVFERVPATLLKGYAPMLMGWRRGNRVVGGVPGRCAGGGS
jgi:hypothetical protein